MFSDVYKWAGVLHRDIGSMTLWEFYYATRGYGEANGTEKRLPTGGLSEDRLSELGIEGF